MRTVRTPCFLFCCFFCTALLLSFCVSAFAGVKDSIVRLDTISKDKENSGTDDKLIAALGIIDEMGDRKKWQEVGKLVHMAEFKNSKYYDELLYIYMAHLANEKKVKVVNNLWNKMSAMKDSIHIFPAMLIRLFAQQNRKSFRYKKELGRIVEYINVTPKDTLIHGAMIEGNFLFGHTVKEDFSTGDLPKLYTMGEYKESAKPLVGFSEDTQYIGILKASNTTLGMDPSQAIQLAGLYEKGGENPKAATIYFSLSTFYWNKKNYEYAEKYVDLTLKNVPDHEDAQKLKKDVSLILVLKGKEKPPAPKKKAVSRDDPMLIPSGKRLSKGDLSGKDNKALRLMRNEIFARYGREFRSEDLNLYFTKQSWYKINPDYSDDLLNAIDRHNILLIREAEEAL